MTCEYFAPKNVGSCRDEDIGICQWKGNYVTPEEKKRRYFVNGDFICDGYKWNKKPRPLDDWEMGYP